MKVVALTGTAAPFARLVDAVLGFAAAHPEADVWIQYGPYGGPRTAPGETYEPRGAILTRIAEADVVVCHAGSGTLRDAIDAGHVPVVLPRRAELGEHVDDHQFDVAQALFEAGRILLADEATIEVAIAEAATRRGPPRTTHVADAFCAAVADDVEATRRRPSRGRGVLQALLIRAARVLPVKRL